MFLKLILLSLISNAEFQDMIHDKSLNLTEAKVSSKKERNTKLKKRNKTVKVYKKKVPRGNLPDYAIVPDGALIGDIDENQMSQITKNSYFVLNKVKTGDVFKLSLDDVIYAIEGKKNKITGVIQSGRLIGSRVLGYTELEPYSKKLLIRFNSLKDRDGSTYDIEAKGKLDGSIFIKPTKYISKRRKNLLGLVLAAFGSSYLQSRVGVNQTLLGNLQDNSMESATYQAGSEGARVIADEFKDAITNEQDVAFISDPRFYEIQFLDSPVSRIK